LNEQLTNINTIMTAFNIIIAGFNAFVFYLNYRHSRKIAEYSKFVDIVQKSDVLIKINTPARNEVIEVTNKGQNTINKIESTILLSVKYRDETTDLGKVKFIRGDDLRPTESFQIPLHEKLRKMLLDSGFMKLREQEVPSGEKDPFTQEDIFMPINVKHIQKEFNLNIKIELKYNVLQEEIKTNKQFEMKYCFENDFLRGVRPYQFEDNYNITIDEISGKWSDS